MMLQAKNLQLFLYYLHYLCILAIFLLLDNLVIYNTENTKIHHQPFFSANNINFAKNILQIF